MTEDLIDSRFGRAFGKDSMFAEWLMECEGNETISPEQLDLLRKVFIRIDTEEHNYEYLLKSILGHENSDRFSHLMSWLAVFAPNYNLKNRYVASLILNILIAFHEKNLITNQTSKQREYSKSLLIAVLESGNTLSNVKNIWAIVIAIIFIGIDTSLQKSHFIKAVEELNGTHDINCFFITLFGAENTPSFYATHFFKCSTEDIKLYFGVLSGQSLRRKLLADQKLSKKENLILHQNLLSLEDIKDRVTERYCVGVKLFASAYRKPASNAENELISKKCNEIDIENLNYVLNSMLSASKIYEYQFDDFSKDLAFWKEVYGFLIILAEDSRVTQLTHCIDYFEDLRYTKKQSIKIKGRNARKILALIDDWNFELQLSQSKDLYDNTSWKSFDIPDTHFNVEGIMYVISEITDGIGLLKEGRALHHCVASYLPFCKSGSLKIFSLSKVEKTNVKPFYTIEVRDNRIQQIAGKYNIPPTEMVMKVIEQWLQQTDKIIPMQKYKSA